MVYFLVGNCVNVVKGGVNVVKRGVNLSIPHTYLRTLMRYCLIERSLQMVTFIDVHILPTPALVGLPKARFSNVHIRKSATRK